MFSRFIPTPTTSQFSVGPLTIHAYALCIIAGVAMAIWIGDRRFRQFGGEVGLVSDLAIWVVPAGVVGGRIYHVITSPDAYFGRDGHPLNALKIWEGGLGIWGAIALGGLVAFWRYQRALHAVTFARFADALAPGILLAQGIGRFGNWFNGELFGRPTNLPWGVEIPVGLRPAGYENFATFHPTFLYEAICNFVLAFLLIKFGNRLRDGGTFYGYVFGYCLYRFFIEGLRIDTAHSFLGLRLNQYVCILLGLVALSRMRIRSR